MVVFYVNTAFEVKGSQLRHGYGNILGIRFPSAYTVRGHTETCLTSNQIKFVTVVIVMTLTFRQTLMSCQEISHGILSVCMLLC